jgi:TIR domain
MRALFRFPKLTFAIGEPHGWLATFIHLRRGARQEASSALNEYLGREIDERSELDEHFLLRLWDEQIAPLNEKQICFYFPIMPPLLTGLGIPLRRVPFAGPALPLDAAFRPRTAVPGERNTAAPDIFVSYAWGEDPTAEGRRLEEIVDRLCDVIRRDGHEIGRDKDHMQSGDLIDEFARDISRASRIVAVISEKSLNSKYCMAYELFSAYRRCNYSRVEFQEKVIALVMDDAQKYLGDDQAVRLSAQWKSRLQSRRRDLESVDPRQNNVDSWGEINLQEEMVTHLPGMIAALNNVKMTRGFEAIVASGFREVLDRLPPVPGFRGAPRGATSLGR